MKGEWIFAGAAEDGPVPPEARRMLRLGVGALSDAELVALIIDEPAVSRGHLDFFRESFEGLVHHHRLTPTAAAKVLATSELARRLPAHEHKRPSLKTPQSVIELLRGQFVGLTREEFHVLILDSRNRLVRQVKVAQGGPDHCHVDPREVLAPAIASRASGLVLVHNHPSGDPEPSEHDLLLTQQLKEGCRLLCIRLVDHVVFGERRHVSLLERGKLAHEPRALSVLKAR